MSVELLDIDRASVAILGSVWGKAPGGRCSDTGRPLSAIGYLGRIKETAYKMYTNTELIFLVMLSSNTVSQVQDMDETLSRTERLFSHGDFSSSFPFFLSRIKNNLSTANRPCRLDVQLCVLSLVGR